MLSTSVRPSPEARCHRIKTQLAVAVEDRAYDQLAFDEWHSACSEAAGKEEHVEFNSKKVER